MAKKKLLPKKYRELFGWKYESDLRNAYIKEYQRIERMVQRERKRGVIYDINYLLPELPKVVTREKLLQIREITPKRAWAVHQKIEPETYRGTYKAKVILSNTVDYFTKAGASTEWVDYIKRELDNWKPQTWWTMNFIAQKELDTGILNWYFQQALISHGVEGLAARLEENANRIADLVQTILYDSEGKDNRVTNALNEMREIMQPGISDMDEAAAFNARAEELSYEDEEV